MRLHGADSVLQADEVSEERGFARGAAGVYAKIIDATYRGLPRLRRLHLHRVQ